MLAHRGLVDNVVATSGHSIGVRTKNMSRNISESKLKNIGQWITIENLSRDGLDRIRRVSMSFHFISVGHSNESRLRTRRVSEGSTCSSLSAWVTMTVSPKSDVLLLNSWHCNSASGLTVVPVARSPIPSQPGTVSNEDKGAGPALRQRCFRWQRMATIRISI